MVPSSAEGTEGRCSYDGHAGTAETLNGKRKIRKEKQDKFQIADKKKPSAGSQEYQPEMFEKFVFSKLPVFQHKNDKVTVSGGFIPFSSPSDSVHYHLIFPS